LRSTLDGRLLGEPVGKTIATPSVLTAGFQKTPAGGGYRRHPYPALIDDPALEGVAMIIFDEFHERSLQADMALALSLDIQRASGKISAPGHVGDH